jgi:hypothetical protein
MWMVGINFWGITKCAAFVPVLGSWALNPIQKATRTLSPIAPHRSVCPINNERSTIAPLETPNALNYSAVAQQLSRAVVSQTA